MIKRRCLIAALIIPLVVLIEVREAIARDIVGNDTNAPLVEVIRRPFKCIPILNSPKRINIYNTFLRLDNLINWNIQGALNLHSLRRKNISSAGRFNAPLFRAGSFWLLSSRLVSNAPSADEINSICATKIFCKCIKSEPGNPVAIRNNWHALMPVADDIRAELDDAYCFLSLQDIKQTSHDNHLLVGKAFQLFNSLGLIACSINKPICLFGRITHFIQLASRDLNLFPIKFISVDAENAHDESNEKGPGSRESTNPVWQPEFPTLVAAAAICVVGWGVMLVAYFWLLFAMAVPKGEKFGWWFDRLNVHLWNKGLRVLIAGVFCSLGVTLGILAVLLALPHLP